jgi:hypothetical protein
MGKAEGCQTLYPRCLKGGAMVPEMLIVDVSQVFRDQCHANQE